MASSIPAARAALFDRLYAASGLNGVQVTFGAPDAHEDAQVVALLGVQDANEEPEILGMQRKEEEYFLEVGIKVHSRDDDARTVDARGFALVDVVRDVVQGGTDYSLNGTVRVALVASLRTDGVLPAEGGGWVIFIRLLIECSAAINRGTGAN